ncbi:MAG: hypothetical protein IPK83_07750 [Planctomycetes bacterium]|nr:hypothetical protein [Planctomycetota bacterium]
MKQARSASQPTSRPTSQSSGSGKRSDASSAVRRLIARLGSPDFKTRESAQALERLGEAAMPTLVEYVGHKNPEIANRVAALIRRPSDPELRVETAIRLLVTADPDWMEMGVYMVFASPLEDYDLLAARAVESKGIERAILQPVVEQLKEWRGITLIHQEFVKKHTALGNTEKIKTQEELHRGSMYYQAESALAYAVEAAIEFKPVDGNEAAPTTKPTVTSRPAASIPRLVAWINQRHSE